MPNLKSVGYLSMSVLLWMAFAAEAKAAACVRSCQTCPSRSVRGHNVVDVVADCGADPADDDTDDTLCVQDAVDCAAAQGGTAFFPAGTYEISSVATTGSVTLRGEGTGSVVRQRAGTSGNMFNVSIDGEHVAFDSLVLDGNRTNQESASANILVRVLPAASSNAMASVEFTRVTFKDQATNSITFFGLKANDRFEHLMVKGCYFRGGNDGHDGSTYYTPRYINIGDHVYANISDNVFDFERSPSVGISAIVISQNGAVADVYSRAVITGNVFRRLGRNAQIDGDNLGVVEFYERAANVVIANNLFESNQYTPIRGKSDSAGIAITSNHVDGSAGGGIHVFRKYQDGMASNGHFIISGNVLRDISLEGIVVFGDYRESGDYVEHLVIDSNIIEGITSSSASAAIRVIRAKGFQIKGNHIANVPTYGIMVEKSTGAADVSGNLVKSSGADGIKLATEVTGLNATLSGNSVWASTDRGLFVFGVNSAHVHGNHVIDVTQSTYDRGIEVRSTSFALVADNIAQGVSDPFFSAYNTTVKESGNSWQ